MIKINIQILFLVILFLSACSTNHKPAPVTNLSSGKTSSKHKIHIKNNQYKVRKGDTLFSIAFSANKDVRAVAKINNITPPYLIYPGQKIYLENSKNKNKKVKKHAVKVVNSKINIQKSNKQQKKELDKPKQREYVQKEQKSSVKVPKQMISKKVQWRKPVIGKVIKRFSVKENGYKGLLIANKHGTPVRAAAAGTVVYAGSALRGYGNLIILKHNDDYLSAYAHNSKLWVKEQQTVKVGQRIADIGNTDATETALRFEIRYRGQAVNPLRFLPKD
ncbi:lipoprotein NlpD [Pseudoalteromonas aurantia 208]|uniref:Lipoprotein NlpD n=1 Tax=Pseudoalteromonas aurantia 208 TaxID=1314867 RepID=A0ABR9EEM2_9GAMM|nr:peptidoglycan DD-metalloendopeptidase family protein [Pseudoalteromonas sp. MMG005]MBE0369430.1 lipoprotein NlpD [Pseudoalteromonas aurantia 208]